MNGYFYVLTIINLFVLSFMCILTKLSEALSKKQKQGFVCAFVLIAGISVLEVITLIVDGKPSSYRWLNIMSNYLGFGLSPAVAICLVYVLDKKTTFKREFKMAVYCELGYLIFLALSIPHGIVFSVDADNIYSRGQCHHVFWGNFVSFDIYDHQGERISKSQQEAHLSTYCFFDGRDDYSGHVTGTACYLVMCYFAFCVVFYLL